MVNIEVTIRRSLTFNHNYVDIATGMGQCGPSIPLGQEHELLSLSANERGAPESHHATFELVPA